MEKKFWLLWVNQSSMADKLPAYRHYDESEARQEARALYLRTGKPVYLMECIGIFQAPEIPDPVFVPIGQNTPRQG